MPLVVTTTNKPHMEVKICTSAADNSKRVYNNTHWLGNGELDSNLGPPVVDCMQRIDYVQGPKIR